MINNILKNEDLVNNPTARVPVCLCLDTSGSMSGEPIIELNKGVRLFYEAVREDETASYSADISIVTFGGTKAECMSDFAGVHINPNPPRLSASGLTPMGEAVNMGLDLLERRKNEYKEAGVDYYQPWLVLMTDGAPNGNNRELARAIDRTVKMVNGRKLTVFPIGIGSEADMNVLAKFSPMRSPLRLRGLRFSEFFQWLSKSVSKTSQSIPGEKIKLDLEGIFSPDGGWGNLN
ncbi:MAG: VWA domain-containing protein [Ruminococcus sp.]|nr:VWA domain-containing protein [Ruminococcus sp.]